MNVDMARISEHTVKKFDGSLAMIYLENRLMVFTFRIDVSGSRHPFLSTNGSKISAYAGGIFLTSY